MRISLANFLHVQKKLRDANLQAFKRKSIRSHLQICSSRNICNCVCVVRKIFASANIRRAANLQTHVSTPHELPRGAPRGRPRREARPPRGAEAAKPAPAPRTNPLSPRRDRAAKEETPWHPSFELSERAACGASNQTRVGFTAPLAGPEKLKWDLPEFSKVSQPRVPHFCH